MCHLVCMVGALAFTMTEQDDADEMQGSIKSSNVEQIVDAEERGHELHKVNLRRMTVKKSEGKQINMALLKQLLISEAGGFRALRRFKRQEAGDIFFVKLISGYNLFDFLFLQKKDSLLLRFISLKFIWQFSLLPNPA